MSDIMTFIGMIEKKQVFLIALFLVTLALLVLLPFTASGAVASAVKNELTPTILEISQIKETQDEILVHVDYIDDIMATDCLESAIAAYQQKFTGLTGQDLIDKLESSTQNAQSVKKALRLKKSYDILYQMDRNLTIEICRFYDIDT